MIDVHQHILPDFYIDALAAVNVHLSGGAKFPKWDLNQHLEMLDRQAIERALLSFSSPGIYFGEQRFAVDLAKRCNDYLAELIAAHPRKFGAAAILPLPDVNFALSELQRAFDELQLDAVILLGNVAGEYLGTLEWNELYQELDRRGATVLVHPNDVPSSQTKGINVPSFVVDFPFDTTRAAANLIFQGVLQKHPRIKWILSHAGGAIPFLAWRVAFGYEWQHPSVTDTLVHTVEKLTGASTRSLLDEGANALKLLQSFYFDTALSAAPFAFAALGEFVPPSQILFGTDYPYAQNFVVAETSQSLNDYNGFEAAEKELIWRGNALQLFPQFAARS